MTVLQEMSSNTWIHPSRTPGNPLLNYYSTAGYVTSCHHTHAIQTTRKMEKHSWKSQNKSVSNPKPMPAWESNTTAQHTPYSHFKKGQIVSIQRQNTRWWDTSRVIETLLNHLYQIRVDNSGSFTLWNCRFFRKLEAPTIPLPISGAFPEPPTPIIWWNPIHRCHKP